jgi:hypothetical protein
MTNFKEILLGGDLRSIGKSNAVVLKINNQNDFDELFKYLFYANRLIVMRAIDAIEKITIINPQYLTNHTNEIIELCEMAKNKELKWHLALLMPRLNLKNMAFENAWDTLTVWAQDKNNSRIVRVNSIQGLYEMTMPQSNTEKDFWQIVDEIEKENIPSINARINNIRKQKTRQ